MSAAMGPVYVRYIKIWFQEKLSELSKKFQQHTYS